MSVCLPSAQNWADTCYPQISSFIHTQSSSVSRLVHLLTSLSDVLRAVSLSVSLNPGWHPGLFLSTVGVAASWRAHLCALTGKSLAFITRDVRLKFPQPLRLPCILYARGPNAACSCAACGGEDQPLLVHCSVSLSLPPQRSAADNAFQALHTLPGILVAGVDKDMSLSNNVTLLGGRRETPVEHPGGRWGGGTISPRWWCCMDGLRNLHTASGFLDTHHVPMLMCGRGCGSLLCTAAGRRGGGTFSHLPMAGAGRDRNGADSSASKAGSS